MLKIRKVQIEFICETLKTVQMGDMEMLATKSQRQAVHRHRTTTHDDDSSVADNFIYKYTNAMPCPTYEDTFFLSSSYRLYFTIVQQWLGLSSSTFLFKKKKKLATDTTHLSTWICQHYLSYLCLYRIPLNYNTPTHYKTQYRIIGYCKVKSFAFFIVHLYLSPFNPFAVFFAISFAFVKRTCCGDKSACQKFSLIQLMSICPF